MASPRRRLFRREAIARRGQPEPLDGLLRVTAPHEWVIVAGLGLALLGALLWAVFGSIERSLSAGCVLVRPGERFAVIADRGGAVVEVLVERGDAVAAGQAVARVSAPDLRRQAALSRVRLAALEAADGAAPAALAAARAELQELERLQADGGVIASPYAGEITALRLRPGQAVELGAEVATVVRAAGAGSEGLEVVSYVEPQSAARLRAGMRAQVLTAGLSSGGGEALAASVRGISPQPSAPPSWLSAAGLDAPARSHLVRLSLDEQPPAAIGDGASCDLRVVLGTDRPVQLLSTGGAG